MGQLSDTIEALRQRADENDCRLVFRAESFGLTIRHSCSAVRADGRSVYDIRGTSEVADVVSDMIGALRQANGEWWVE